MIGEIERPLSEYAADGSVENVYVFVADSLRADSLPNVVEERGVTARAVAPSTFTASSLPSLLSGHYPATHRIWDFDGVLDREPILLRECPNTGFDAETIWTHLEPEEKPPLRMVRTDSGEPLDSIAEPFVFVEHDKGGHTPYGYAFDECDSTDEFYRERVSDRDQIPDLYERGIARAADRFLDHLSVLESRGILENTLVIFTSDHGENLGEFRHGRIYEHGTPMTPELIYVPMVFLGAGLPEGKTYRGLLSGVDVVPTALGAQNRPVPSSLPGYDAWNERVPENRTARSEMWKEYDFREPRTVYGVSSVWSDEGGHVFHRGSRLVRAAFSLYWHLYAGPAAAIRTYSPTAQLRLLRTYVPAARTYGTPGISREEARELLPGPFARRTASADAYTREQLSKLGYR